MMVLHGIPRKNGNSDTLTEYFIKGVCARAINDGVLWLYVGVLVISVKLFRNIHYLHILRKIQLYIYKKI